MRTVEAPGGPLTLRMRSLDVSGNVRTTDTHRVAAVMTGTGETLTYGALEERSLRLAHQLRDLGFRRGDVIALLADNSPRVFEIYWAAQRIGLYVTAVNHRLGPEEIRYIVEDCEARAVFVSGALTAAAEALNGTAGVVWRGGRRRRARRVRDYGPRSRRRGPPRSAISRVVATCCTRRARPGGPKGIDPAAGRPVDEPGDAMVGLFGPRFGFDERTVYLSPAPLYHAAPLRICATVQALGGTVVVMERFDAEAALAPSSTTASPTASGSRRCSSGCSSSTSGADALRPLQPADRRPRRRALPGGGQAADDRLVGADPPRVLLRRPRATAATMIDTEEWSRHPGSVGRAVLGTIHICGEDGERVAGRGDRHRVLRARRPRPSPTTTTPRRPRQAQHPAHRPGRRSATSATSTRTATSTSPTARRSRSSPAG